LARGKWHIESHYPTQAKRRLEWGTQHLLLVWKRTVVSRMPWASWSGLTAVGLDVVADFK
jgi:hypothetical protein